MKRRTILLVVGLVLVAFVLGRLVGSRHGQKPMVSGPIQSSGAPASPVAGGTGACADFRDAGSQVGTSGCVSGQVLGVFTSRAGNTFLDFCPDYRSCPFTSVIFASDKNKFGDLESLQGKRVEIRGAITVYQSRAEIIIRDPQQIRRAP
ncbi:MAG: hypothetical protein LAO04_02135 [Acidobacteriia bacterium]|nr:hypothetical protein [Terriglobia bacterium]